MSAGLRRLLCYPFVTRHCNLFVPTQVIAIANYGDKEKKDTVHRMEQLGCPGLTEITSFKVNACGGSIDVYTRPFIYRDGV